MKEAFLMVVIATSIWVLIDAKTLGIKSDPKDGSFAMGPVSWFFSCLLLWIVAFPSYLITRAQHKAAQSISEGFPILQAQQVPSTEAHMPAASHKKIPIRCPGCGKVSGVPREKIPEGGVRATCKQCGHVFHVVIPAETVPPVIQRPMMTPQPVHRQEPQKGGISFLRIGLGVASVLAFIWIYANSSTVGGSPSLSLVGEKNFTISVKGADRLPYTGHIFIINADGTNRSQSVDGNVPKTYSFSGAISVSCTFQKHSNDSAPLALEVTNGVKQETARTTSPFGVVSAAL